MEASGPQTFATNGQTAEDRTLGELVNQISENASLLIREEIELARAEVELKIKRLVQGAAIGFAAGFFALLGLIFLFNSMAWGVAETLPIWLGFLITTGTLFVLAGIAGFVASRAFKAGAPPTPDTAIEEAKLIREALEHPDVQAASTAQPSPEVSDKKDEKGK